MQGPCDDEAATLRYGGIPRLLASGPGSKKLFVEVANRIRPAENHNEQVAVGPPNLLHHAVNCRDAVDSDDPIACLDPVHFGVAHPGHVQVVLADPTMRFSIEESMVYYLDPEALLEPQHCPAFQRNRYTQASPDFSVAPRRRRGK